MIENEIVGEALVALRHDELKEMGVASVGHRLTILKGVYDVKVKHDVPIEVDHYVPLCKLLAVQRIYLMVLMEMLAAEASMNNKKATQEDISRIIQSIKLRDERILAYEAAMAKVNEDYRKIREEILPMIRIAKDKSQPLPYQPGSPDFPSHDNMASTVMNPFPQEKQSSSNLGRKLSKKGPLWLNNTPKNASPTYPHPIAEGKTLPDSSTLDPSAAAIAASSHLTAQMNGGTQTQNSPNPNNLPSPTSPNPYHNQPSSSRGYRDGDSGSAPSTGRSQYNYSDDPIQFGYNSSASTLVGDSNFRSAPTPTPGRPRGNTRDQEDSPSGVSGGAPSVEIFKSFRVSMEDPCYKVLPAALKRYNISADWRQYALYIVYGDQERCLGLEDKPLILFKQLDKEGRKPIFMLRRHAAPIEGHSGPTGSSMMGFDGASINSGRGQSQIQLPGGVL